MVSKACTGPSKSSYPQLILSFVCFNKISKSWTAPSKSLYPQYILIFVSMEWWPFHLHLVVVSVGLVQIGCTTLRRSRSHWTSQRRVWLPQTAGYDRTSGPWRRGDGTRQTNSNRSWRRNSGPPAKNARLKWRRPARGVRRIYPQSLSVVRRICPQSP